MSDTAFGKPPTVELGAVGLHAPLERASAEALAPFQARLQNHQICCVIPAGATFDVLTMKLPGGLLVLGALRGKVFCATGSAIIAEGGEFQGYLEANDVMVEGMITSPLGPTGKPIAGTISDVHARGQTDAQGRLLGGVIAVSANASVCSKMRAVSFSIPRNANMSGSIMQTITR